MKTFLKKHWPLFGIGLLGLILLFYLVRGQGGFLPGPLIRAVIPKEGVHLENIHYTQDDSDDRFKWTLDAEEAQFSKDRNRIAFKEFRIRLETEDRPFFELTGQSGRYNQSSGLLNLKGALKGRTEDGYSITTEQLLYERAEGTLNSDQLVRIAGPFFSLEGKGFRCNLENETLTVHANVITVIDKEGLIL